MSMHAPTSGPARAARSSARVVRALGALAALAALLVGVPVLLTQLGTWPVTGVPTGEQIRELPSTIVTDQAILGVVTVVLWAAWALFVLSVVVEVVAQARSRRRPPGGGAAPSGAGDAGRAGDRSVGGPVRGLARYLVGSLMMSAAPVLTIGHALPAGAQSAVSEVSSAAVADPGFWEAGADRDRALGFTDLGDLDDPSWDLTGPTVPAAGADAASPASAQFGPVDEVTVERGDTAWSLAAGHLGDGARWRDLWETNRDRVQPDGRVWADADESVRPGWSLRLPTGAAEPSAAAPDVSAPAAGGAVDPNVPPVQALTRPVAAPVEVTVRPGDNFWDLAETQLTEAWGRAPTDAEVVGHWQSLIATNRDALAPPGDPDLIAPGQVFGVPTPPPDPAVMQGLAGDLVVGTPAPTAPREGPPGAPDCAPDEAGAPGAGSGTDATADSDAAGDTDSTAPASGEEGPATTPGPSTTESDRGDAEVGAPPRAEEADPDASDTGGDDADDGEADAGVITPAPGGEAAPSPDDGEPTGPDGGSPGPGSGADAPGETPTRPAAATSDEGDRSLVPVGLAGGGVALAGALLLLERRRRAQQRHRGAGRVVPLPTGPGRLGEQQLRWGADIEGAQLLDVALRAVAANAGATGLPRLAWTEASRDGVLLALDQPAAPPPGFVEVDSTRWTTAATADELSVVAASAAAPAPALVPVGTTEYGAELLVDLETSGVVTVDGAPDEVVGLLRALVVALSTAPWSDQPRVVTVGFEPVLERLPGVEAVTSLDVALDLAEEHATAVETALRSLRCPTVAQARAVGATPEAWDPLVVVSSVAPGDRAQRRRLEDLADRRNAAVGMLVVPSIDTGMPGRRLAIGDHGWLAIDGVPEPVRPRHLDADAAAQLVGLLAAAEDRRDEPVAPAVVELALRRPPPPPAAPPPPPPPTGMAPTGPEPAAPALVGRGDDPVPVGEEDHELHASSRAAATPAAPRRLAEVLTGVDVLIRVLGEVSASRLTGPDGGGEPLVPTRQRALEAVAYLALRESAVDREDLEISLFPDGANAAKTVYNTVSSARALLGDELFPPPAGGRYELSSAVVTDYGIFSELVAEADETEDALAAADLLHEALSLVRGEPFTGVGRSYAWVGPHRGMIVAQVVDAAEELAEVRLAGDDWRGAEWAARQGLRAFPSDERMYRLLMRTARAAGNIPGVQRVFRELCDVLADPDLGVEPDDTVHPETIELLEQLTGTRPREGRLGA